MRNTRRKEAYHERARDVTPERAGAEQETAGIRDFVQVERGKDTPSHELEIQVYSLVREPESTVSPVPRGRQLTTRLKCSPCRVHHRSEICDTSPELALYVLLPSNRARLLRRCRCLARSLLHDPKSTLLSTWGAGLRDLAVTPAQDAEALCRVSGVQHAEIRQKVA